MSEVQWGGPTAQRVLMTTDTVGGVWSFTLDLAQALGAHGVEVIATALGGPPSPEQRAEADRIPNLHLLASDFKLEWMEDPWRDVEDSGRWLLELEKQNAPDVVHLNSFGHGALPWNAPVVLTAHSCVVSWWSAVRRTPLPAEWDRYRGEVARALRAADVLTVPSHAMMRAIQDNYGADLAVRVVHNGRNHARYRQSKKEAIVFTAGRVWDEAKNIQAVVRVAPRLAWPVYVAGEQRSIDLSGCNTLGRLSMDAMANWYARASIFVLPARYEPFGLAPLEAALSGSALILGDIASLREVWGEAAIFVPPDDSAALESALRSLIEQSEFRRIMAQRAMERAREFTAERMADAYVDVYQTAMQTRRVACTS